MSSGHNRPEGRPSRRKQTNDFIAIPGEDHGCIFAFETHRPVIAATTYIAPSAQIIGKVTIGERCYIGHGAILRGDFGSIEIGEETAIEEGVIVHSRPNECTRIGARVIVGHGAMVHNATVNDGAVIGMRAAISDYAEVGAGSIVGEMGLVKNHPKIPPGKVAVGVPVRIVGDIDERHHMMTHTAKTLYVALARLYADGDGRNHAALTRVAQTCGRLMRPCETDHLALKPFATNDVAVPLRASLSDESQQRNLSSNSSAPSESSCFRNH